MYVVLKFCTTIDVELAENETVVSNASRDGQQLVLNCSVAKANPLPWLHQLRLTDSQSESLVQNNYVIKDNLLSKIGNYKVLSKSSHGNVEYNIGVVTKKNEGHYVCVATLLDQQQTLKSVLVLTAGKNFSPQRHKASSQYGACVSVSPSNLSYIALYFTFSKF